MIVQPSVGSLIVTTCRHVSSHEAMDILGKQRSCEYVFLRTVSILSDLYLGTFSASKSLSFLENGPFLESVDCLM